MSRMPCKIRRSAIAWGSGREPELRDQPGVQPPPPSVTTVSWLGVETGTRRTRVDGPDSLHTMCPLERQLAVGQLVRFISPLNEDERGENFTVLELRGERALV